MIFDNDNPLRWLFLDLNSYFASIEQLCALSKVQMKKIWSGIVGERFWHWLRGDDIAEPPTQKGTVGHSHVLPPDLRTEDGAYAVAQKLLQKAATRLRKMSYYAGGLALSLRFVRDQNWSPKPAWWSAKIR
jgi:DNA polymerase-4